MTEPEIQFSYPERWEDEYRETLRVAAWHQDFPALFAGVPLSKRAGTLDLFAQYALMYLLRRGGVWSLTWYKLANKNPMSVNRERTDECWREMQSWMGVDDFARLQDAICSEFGTSSFAGEPDLFCWKPDTGEWFFAEAKGKDRQHEKQLRWFQVCRDTLGPSADIRVYRLRAET